MAILSRLIYKFNTVPIKIQQGISQNWQSDPKMCTEDQKTKEILKKNTGEGEEGTNNTKYQDYYKL